MTPPKHQAVITRAYRLYLEACRAARVAGQPWRALSDEERWCWMMEAWGEHPDYPLRMRGTCGEEPEEEVS